MKTLMVSLNRCNSRTDQDAYIEELESLGMKQVCYCYYSGMDSPDVYFIADPDSVPEFDDRIDGHKWFDDTRHVLTMGRMKLATAEQKASIQKLVDDALET